MRAHEFLIEYDRTKTVQSLGKKLLLSINNDSTFRNRTADTEKNIDLLMTKIEAIDPTPRKLYTRWITTQYKAGNVKFEDLYKLGEDLTTFNELKTQLKRRGHSVDINSYSVKEFKDMISSINDVEQESDDDLGEYENIDDVTVLYNGPYGSLVIPETEKASCEIGSGTRWCTAAKKSDNLFNEYNKTGQLYAWKDRKGDKYQFHLNQNTCEFSAMDSSDDQLTPEQISEMQTYPVLKKLFEKFDEQVIKMVEESLLQSHDMSSFNENLKNYVELMHPDGWDTIEDITRQSNPVAAVNYAIGIRKQRWPEAEENILTDIKAAVHYAIKLVREPWPELEKILLSNNEHIQQTMDYAIGVRRRNWPELENKLIKDNNYKLLIYYANYVLRGRFPKAESIIIKTAPIAEMYKYVNQIAQERIPDAESRIANEGSLSIISDYISKYRPTRWKEAEPVIIEHASEQYLGNYIKKYVDEPWPEAEALILKKMPNLIVDYALHVLHGPWPEAEKWMFNRGINVYMKEYHEKVIKGDWPLMGKFVTKHGSVYDIIDYQNKYIKAEWPEAEHAIAEKNDIKDILYYMSQVKKSPWPEVEPIILDSNNTFNIISYAKHAGKRWPAGEQKLLKSGDLFKMTNYVQQVIHGPWPEAEPLLKQSDNAWSMYQKIINGEL